MTYIDINGYVRGYHVEYELSEVRMPHPRDLEIVGGQKGILVLHLDYPTHPDITGEVGLDAPLLNDLHRYGKSIIEDRGWSSFVSVVKIKPLDSHIMW